jgi:hypothetical protein
VATSHVKLDSINSRELRSRCTDGSLEALGGFLLGLADLLNAVLGLSSEVTETAPDSLLSAFTNSTCVYKDDIGISD